MVLLNVVKLQTKGFAVFTYLLAVGFVFNVGLEGRLQVLVAVSLP